MSSSLTPRRPPPADGPAPAGPRPPADGPAPAGPRPPADRSAPDGRPAPPPFAELELTPAERTQIEEQLAGCFGLTPAAARVWVESTARRGVCYGRVLDGRVVASFAAETLPLVRGAERLTAVMLQSCFVHPDVRGRGFGLERADVDGLRRRFAADAVVLTLFDDGLIPYWRRRGFEVVQRAEIVTVADYAARAERAFSPVLDEAALAAKLAEVRADGATITEQDGFVLVRYPGDEAVDELVVRAAQPGLGAVNGSSVEQVDRPSDDRERPVRVRLKTVMASPGGLDLVCAIDL